MYSYNEMRERKRSVFNYVVFVMFDGDYGACDDAASYSFLYFEQSDFFHH